MPKDRDVITVLILDLLLGIWGGVKFPLLVAFVVGAVFTGGMYLYMDRRDAAVAGQAEYLTVVGLFCLGCVMLATLTVRGLVLLSL